MGETVLCHGGPFCLKPCASRCRREGVPCSRSALCTVFFWCLQKQINRKQTMIDELERDQSDLMTKISRKQEELKRAQKRMRALKNVRYAYCCLLWSRMLEQLNWTMLLFLKVRPSERRSVLVCPGRVEIRRKLPGCQATHFNLNLSLFRSCTYCSILCRREWRK